MLRQQLAEAKPKVGELVAIRYAGKVKGQSGSEYHAYRVAVDRQPSEWDVAATPEDEQSVRDLGQTDQVPF